MPTTSKLSSAQVYLLAWMIEKDRHCAGSGICKTNSVPCMLRLPDERYINEPHGVGMPALNGLVRRGLAEARGAYGSIFTVTDSGRRAFARSPLVEEMAAERAAEQTRNATRGA